MSPSTQLTNRMSSNINFNILLLLYIKFPVYCGFVYLFKGPTTSTNIKTIKINEKIGCSLILLLFIDFSYKFQFFFY